MSVGLELQGVGFAYGERRVLEWLDLRIEPGEMVALLGANGCGKTTLLRLASGALAPQRGRVIIGGKDARAYRARDLARVLAVLPQELQVPPGWSVREVVGLGRTPHIGLLSGERSTDRLAVQRALELTEAEGLADRAFDTISGGQKQRVAVALAVAQEPRALLLDEPTAHLDLRYRAALLDAVAGLHAGLSLTLLAAMHDPSLAALYFPRLVLLAHGRVLADGAPREVLREELLEEAYGAPVRVTFDPVLGVPLVSVLPAGLREREGALRWLGDRDSNPD